MNAVWQKLVDSLSPLQACWVCILITGGATLYAVDTFAKNDDVEAIRIELLQKRLLDLRLEQCRAIKEGRTAAFFSGQITEQSDKYQQLTKRRPQLPTCTEL
jgi:hypothetical protein